LLSRVALTTPAIPHMVLVDPFELDPFELDPSRLTLRVYPFEATGTEPDFSAGDRVSAKRLKR
jgi:hypothetical protein